MKYTGHVVWIKGDEVGVFAEPDDNRSDEAWTVERKWFPPAWLQVGALFELEVGPKEGHVVWTFNCSYWTRQDVEEAKKEADALCVELGIPLHESDKGGQDATS